ncbi:hypothetical protein jhhlp_007335 [Lomentospora prolificans]|uniref:WLM domain-containing protein n=1 Tax=Lomentospora prolificans TaxID=41688 RepID=A0A2N3N2E2_9PEZI|nr:hypothetical protein jhhlp_007335 [Lomentospora prolificans]
MSLGFQRLNVKKTPPNPHIDFIKPLPGRDEAIALDFLERIAAQCVPVMKKNYLFVRSLEEYEPNREFVGRNFNAGEVIQLVLKCPRTGKWLPFNYVQMVMMHELAHCKQMNHSRAFWAVRNQYAREMEGLWAKNYVGEGLWGRGRELSSGQLDRPTVLTGESLPEHICGGTYQTRGRGRKRRAVNTLTWKEQKERRILKKFGANGVTLGSGAEDERVKLENGKRIMAKPRVAQSQRGRELRAAAALARLETSAKPKEPKESEVITIDSDDSDGYEVIDLTDTPDAVDINGSRLLDKDGIGMVKVCGDEQENSDEASIEFRELMHSFQNRPAPRAPPEPRAKQESKAQPTVAELFKRQRALRDQSGAGNSKQTYK